MNNRLSYLRNRSIELFNCLSSFLKEEHRILLFEYEEVITEMQLMESKMPDDNSDDINKIKFD